MVVGVDIPTRYELRLSSPVLQISNAGGWESDTYLEKFMVSKVPSFSSNARPHLVRKFAKMILKRLYPAMQVKPFQVILHAWLHGKLK